MLSPRHDDPATHLAMMKLWLGQLRGPLKVSPHLKITMPAGYAVATTAQVETKPLPFLQNLKTLTHGP